MKISYLNMAPMHHELDGDMKQKFADVYFNNWFIMGKELEAFEEEYAAVWRWVFNCVSIRYAAPASST